MRKSQGCHSGTAGKGAAELSGFPEITAGGCTGSGCGRCAQAQPQAETQAKAEAQAAREAETQRAYSEALNTYQTKTLPQYQQELGQLNTDYVTAQNAYNQADTAYQMAFAQWQADLLMRMHRLWMMRRQQEVRQRSPASRQRKLMRTKRPASRKCRNIPITVTVRTAGDFVTDGTQRKHRI